MYLFIGTRVATTLHRRFRQVCRKMASADTFDDAPDVDFLVSTYFHMGYQYKEIMSMLAQIHGMSLRTTYVYVRPSIHRVDLDFSRVVH